MRIRDLELKDAGWMLEWMRDDELVKDMFTDFSGKDLTDCEEFIRKSRTDNENLHLAIADENDIYMGTVSLKHIDFQRKIAEFAITVRRTAMGRGYASYGMKEVLKKAKYDLELKEIYWCVLQNNTRAIRFYNKNGFVQCTRVPLTLKNKYSADMNRELIWYYVCLN